MSAAAPNAGFTLLEVSVALAVLALGLVAVVDINAGAARLHEQSQHLSLGTLLAKGKMVDLEQKLNEDGFSDFDQQIDGTFDEQGHPEIRWHAEVLKPDVTKANDQITQLVTGALGGGATNGGGGGGNPLAALTGSALLPPGTSLPSGLGPALGGAGSSADPNAPTGAGLSGLAGGAMTGLIQSQVGGLVTLIQKGLREVRLTITWPEGNAKEDSLSLATHLVVLAPTGTGVSNANGTPAGQGTSPAPGAAGQAGAAGAAGSALPGSIPGLGALGGGLH